MTLMLLRYDSTMSAISGVCHGCDYSMKWLILQGNISTTVNSNIANPTIAPADFRNDQAAKLEVVR